MKPTTTLLTFALGLSAWTGLAQQEPEPPARPDPAPRWAAPESDQEMQRPLRRRQFQDADAERPADTLRSERRGARRPQGLSEDSQRPERPGRPARRGPAWGPQGQGRGPAFAGRGPGSGAGRGQPFRNQDRSGVCPACGCPGCGPQWSPPRSGPRQNWAPNPQGRGPGRGAGRGGPPWRDDNGSPE